MNDINKIKLATHNGGFHADDVFAAATLGLLLERDGRSVEIVRTRDQEMIAGADFVFDVGGVYDPEANRFDHHQEGGGGVREDGIPYAAFGLVWKKYGKELSGSEDVAVRLEKHIVEPIDAFDNGVDIFTPTRKDIWPLTMHTIVGIFNANWNEVEEKNDEHFLVVVGMAKVILKRAIVAAKSNMEVEDAVKETYVQASDKRMLIFDKPYGRVPLQMALVSYPDVLIAVFPHITREKWHATMLHDNEGSFKLRKDFPKAWAGLRDEALAQVTGVPDAVFCHNGRFLVVSNSKEGAVALAEKALLE